MKNEKVITDAEVLASVKETTNLLKRCLESVDALDERLINNMETDPNFIRGQLLVHDHAAEYLLIKADLLLGDENIRAMKKSNDLDDPIMQLFMWRRATKDAQEKIIDHFVERFIETDN